MLIRISAGAAGIAEYLERGRKRGREFERDMIDERMPLFGNLEQIGLAIKTMHTRTKDANRYLHITLGFAERFQVDGDSVAGMVTLETLRAVDEDFRRYFMAAYAPEEYQYYSEAHVPKLSHEIGADGVTRERLPHIHVVIPLRNLVDGRYLNPRGHGVANLRYIDAIQETINLHHHLKSPKSARRQIVPDPISRHGSPGTDLRLELEKALSAGDIANLDSLGKWATRFGEVRVRQGRDGRYLNVKMRGAQRGINLKAYSEAYFAGRDGAPPADEAKTLAEQWRRQVAFEVRYITSQHLSRYRALSDQDKRFMLEGFMRKTADSIRRLHESLGPRVDAFEPISSIAPEPLIRRLARRTPRESPEDRMHRLEEGGPRKARLSALNVDASNSRTVSRIPLQPTPEQLKRETRAQLVIAFAASTFGIDPAQYTAGWATDGSPRILHQDRQYNLGDFFTKHLKNDWTTARAALVVCWNQSKRDGLAGVDRGLWSEFEAQRLQDVASRRGRRNEILQRWQQERERIRADWHAEVAVLQRRSRQRPVAHI